MAASERLASVRAKIERAKHHVRDLEARLDTFRQLRPYRLFSETESDTGHTVHKVRVHHQPSAELSLVAGEVIHQLRSGLDHLAWQLWDANGRTGREKLVYFPVYETEPEYITVRPGKIQAFFGPAAVSILDTLQPHATGNSLLWKLHQMNNIDKHRRLSLVACSVVDLALTFPSFAGSPRVGIPNTSAIGAPRVIEDGAVICATHSFRTSGTPLLPEMQPNLEVAFEIVFNEPGVVEGEAVLHFLEQLTGLVDGVIQQFVSLL